MVNNCCTHIDQICLPGSDTYVYKDECTQCFYTSESAGGLYVCLKCFNGGCSIRKHSESHFKNTKHAIAMQIIKIRSLKENNFSTEKKEPFEEEEFNYKAKLICFVCGILDDNIIKNFDVLKHDIIKSTNASNLLLARTATYDQLSQCLHSLDLFQTKSATVAEENFPVFERIFIDKTHCGKCEMSESLWFCLSCGAVSCGRKNFDGSGGNNHGLEHFNATHHPLAVKIGTVSQAGKGDVFCYVCDDSVTNPFVLKQLSFFGITSFDKTEKDTKEMELEMNRKYDWSKLPGDNEDKKRLFGSGFTGIHNINNSCYISCVIQIVMTISRFYDLYYTEGKKHLKNCSRADPAACFQCQMSKLADGIYSGDFSAKEEIDKESIMTSREVTGKDSINNEVKDDVKIKEPVPSERNGISVCMAKSLICKDNFDFLSYEQQDAFEFLIFFLSQIDKAETTRSPSVVFNFEIETKIQCTECKCAGYSKDLTNFISLPMKQKGPSDLAYCFEQWSSDEAIEGYDCDVCQKKTKILKTLKMKSFPKILAVQMKRFDIENNQIIKNENAINCPEKICLEELRGMGLQENEMPFPKRVKSDYPILGEIEVNKEHLDNLIAMGFEETISRKALISNKNDFETAFSLLCNENEASLLEDSTLLEKDYSIDKITEKSDLESTFELFASISHIGESVDAGHYIAHVKKQGQWVCFNDMDIFASSRESSNGAYVLFFINTSETDVIRA